LSNDIQLLFELRNFKYHKANLASSLAMCQLLEHKFFTFFLLNAVDIPHSWDVATKRTTITTLNNINITPSTHRHCRSY